MTSVVKDFNQCDDLMTSKTSKVIRNRFMRGQNLKKVTIFRNVTSVLKDFNQCDDLMKEKTSKHV